MTRIQTVCAVLAGVLAASLAGAAEIKIGAFDYQKVTQETARGQDLQKSLAGFRDKKQQELLAKEGELKALHDQYNAQALSLSPEKRSQTEKEIQKKELELENFRDGAQKEMQLELSEAQARFQEQLFRVIVALGKERGYSAIFERSQGVFFSDATDISSEVIERFNLETSKAPPAGSDAGAGAKPPDAPKPPSPGGQAPPAAPKSPGA